MCDELNNALHREQQAQQLLNEQTVQMQDLSARIELHANQGEEKDATLSEAVKVRSLVQLFSSTVESQVEPPRGL